MTTGRTTDDRPTTATVAYLTLGGPAIIVICCQADEQVVSKGLEDNAEERTALRSKPGPVRIISHHRYLL